MKQPGGGRARSGAQKLVLRDGLELAYSDLGQGSTLCLVHGFTGSRDAWGRGLVYALSQSRRVLAVDLVGHGSSAVPAHHERCRIEEMVADLEELFLALDVEAVDLLGYSMGARVSLAAALPPTRVRRLVLESGSPGLDDESARAKRRASDGALARSLVQSGLGPFLEHWKRHPVLDTGDRVSALQRAEADAQRASNDPKALAAVLLGLGTGAQPSFWQRLGEVPVPTLVMVGALDLKFKEIGTEMARGIPGAELRVVAGAGHRVHLEAPDSWLEAVLGFLE